MRLSVGTSSEVPFSSARGQLRGIQVLSLSVRRPCVKAEAPLSTQRDTVDGPKPSMETPLVGQSCTRLVISPVGPWQRGTHPCVSPLMELSPHRRYEDGQVGDANINTQDPKIQKEIMRVIGTQVYTN